MIDHIPTDETEPDVIRRFLEEKSGLSLTLFGSHMTGLAGPVSDIDFVIAVEGNTGVGLAYPTPAAVEAALIPLGFKAGAFYTAERPDMLARGELGVLKAITASKKMVDVIMLTPNEFTRRTRTLSVIKELVDRGDPHVAAFIRYLKYNTTGYAALHSIVEAAQGGRPALDTLGMLDEWAK